ncbi:unnamed protein product, partial [marine sediment metagenome]
YLLSSNKGFSYIEDPQLFFPREDKDRERGDSQPLENAEKGNYRVLLWQSVWAAEAGFGPNLTYN